MEEWKMCDADNDELTFTTPLPDDKILECIPKDAKILDLACGYGRVLKYFSEKGYRNLTGNDISENLIARARQNVPEGNFVGGDMTEFDSHEKFDLIILMGAIEYVLEDEGQEKFLSLIRDMLPDGGYLYLESFVLDNFAFLKQYIRGFLRHLHWGRFINSRGYDCHHNSIASLRLLILEQFEIVIEMRRKIRTWSGKLVNGYSVLAKKKG